MAEEPGTSGGSQRPESPTPPPRDKSTPGPARRKGPPRSVLKVSQLLLRAIAAHKGLTLAALKKELGHAGYQVRRRSGSPGGDSRPDPQGALLRVSGGSAAGCFRVCKAPKPQRKRRGAAPAEEAAAAAPRAARRPPKAAPKAAAPQRRAARKAREAWGTLRGPARAARPPSQGPRTQPPPEAGRARTRGGGKAREEKRPEEPPREEPSPGPARMHDPRATRSKSATRAEGARKESKSP